MASAYYASVVIFYRQSLLRSSVGPFQEKDSASSWSDCVKRVCQKRKLRTQIEVVNAKNLSRFQPRLPIGQARAFVSEIVNIHNLRKSRENHDRLT
jgi:hypothetical protein